MLTGAMGGTGECLGRSFEGGEELGSGSVSVDMARVERVELTVRIQRTKKLRNFRFAILNGSK